MTPQTAYGWFATFSKRIKFPCCILCSCGSFDATEPCRVEEYLRQWDGWVENYSFVHVSGQVSPPLECHIPFTHASCFLCRAERVHFALCSFANSDLAPGGSPAAVSGWPKMVCISLLPLLPVLCTHTSCCAAVLFSALFYSLGIWTWSRNLRLYANVLMMLFAYLEVIYKTLHMELLKTWHQ